MELASVPEHAIIQGMVPQLGLKSECWEEEVLGIYPLFQNLKHELQTCHVTTVSLGEVSKSGPRVSESHTSQMSLVKIQLTDRKYSFCPYWGASDTPGKVNSSTLFLASYCEREGRALGSRLQHEEALALAVMIHPTLSGNTVSLLKDAGFSGPATQACSSGWQSRPHI